MLPKRRRLVAEEVREVLRRGRTTRATYLSLKHLPGPLSLRTSAVVSKSMAKKAVERNRLRRAVYRVLAPLRGGTGLGIVFVQKVPPPPLTPAFAADMELLLKKAN